MDVTVTNEGRQYTFGFYLWKRAGGSSGSGSLNDLLSTGQKSLFERSANRLMTVIHDADVKVKTKADALIITLRNKDELKRLFSSKPTEVVFKLKLPGEDETSQNVAVVYQLDWAASSKSEQTKQGGDPIGFLPNSGGKPPFPPCE